MFLLVGAGAAFFKAAPAASFRQAKNKSLVLVSNMSLRAVKKGKYGLKLFNFLEA